MVASTGAAVHVSQAGASSVLGKFAPRPSSVIPAGFIKVCSEQGWSVPVMWNKLSDVTRPWYEASTGAYIYYNRSDQHWWIDAPDGAGVYIAPAGSQEHVPPTRGWRALPGAQLPLPTLTIESDE